MTLLLVSTFEVFGAKLEAIIGERLKKSRVVCIPTAAYAEDGYESWLPAEIEAVRKLADDFIELDINGKNHGEIKAATDNADIIYVTGGNTYHLLEQARACRLKECVENCLARAGMYLGSSAGAIISGPRIDFIGDMDPNHTSLNDFTGMSLVDFLFMPHTDQPRFAPQAHAIMKELKSGGENIIGLRDDQGLLVDGRAISVY